MNASVAVVLGSLFFGLMSGYTTRVASRSQATLDGIQQQSLIRQAIGALSFVALVAVIVWAFINIPWYWTIGGFLGISLLVIPILFSGGSRFALWYGLQPVFDLIVLGGAVFVWIIV